MENTGQNIFTTENTVNSITVENPKLPKASRIAVIGMIILAASNLIGIVISMMLTNQLNELISMVSDSSLKSNPGSNMGGTIFSFAIIAIFLVLAVRMKNAKAKTIPVLLIVFSAIFILLSIGTMLVLMAQLGSYDQIISGSHLTSQIQNQLNVIKQTATMAFIPGVISLAGWITTLSGAIIGATATQDEIMQNN